MVDDLKVTDRIHISFDMCDIAVRKSASHVKQSVRCLHPHHKFYGSHADLTHFCETLFYRDIGKELVAQAFALVRAFYKPSDISHSKHSRDPALQIPCM